MEFMKLSDFAILKYLKWERCFSMRFLKFVKHTVLGRINRGIFLFLVSMAGMTVLSKIGDFFMIPQVEVGFPEQAKLEYPVEIEGRIKADGERAVYGREGLRIGHVKKQKGDFVKKGDLLFVFDKKELDLQIKGLEQKIYQCDLQIDNLEDVYQDQVNQQRKNLQRAQEDYNDILNSMGNAVDAAYLEMENAKAELEQHDNINPKKMQETEVTSQDARTAKEGPIPQDAQTAKKDLQKEEDTQNAWADKRAELEQNYLDMQKHYDDAVALQQESVKSALRQLEDARQTVSRDPSSVLVQMEKKELEESLEELKELHQAGGNVYCEFDGQVLDCSIATGSITSMEPVMILEDFSQSFEFEGMIETSVDPEVGEGTECTIEIKPEHKVLEGMRIEKVEAKDVGKYQVTVPLGPDAGTYPGDALLSCTKESRLYDNCVPVSALYSGETGDFVIQVKEEVTILGMQAVAEYVPVTIIEKNNLYAAVKENLSKTDSIIINASKPIKEGDRVRIIEK